MSESVRRIAAIDVGTNSIHMIVAERRNGGYRVVDKEKEMVQLGLSSLDGAPLSDDAIERGTRALQRMTEVARGWDVADIIAVATSAVREAPNRREFLRQVKETTGIKVRVISGEEEADYIFRAVRAATPMEGTALCIDIGGGSVELIVGTMTEVYLTASLPLGSLRLAQRFDLRDRPSAHAVESCRRYVHDHLRRAEKRIRGIGIDSAIGTSGTIQAIANIATPPTEAVGPRAMTREALREAITRLENTSLRERVETFGIDEKRAGTIVAGAIVLDEIVSALRVSSIVVCQAAIREGIVETYFAGDGHLKHGRSVRRRSALALADRSDCDLRHARHVARLAARIFDQTQRLHALPPDSREILEHAAILHEAGMHVSDRGYHKHTYYLVRHADLRGFTEEQLIVVANVARYHRKAKPADDHENLRELSPAQRGDIEKLAAILRIAEALDRSHRQSVRDVAVRCNGRIKFYVRTRCDASVEIEAAAKRARYFADLFEKKVRFESM